ncbi:hypothetical protein FNV43_RR16276 [Rhamnella rubrinervis]|uniref:Uncharacterized protein n=1 Tax=Rhamnella rubrinervis TaxID=2594499 RepID=A0A8K0GYH8_9ROSA|nr:hypothetical protein FNV43_RR16276 [Rhamnella rubrinervis]
MCPEVETLNFTIAKGLPEVIDIQSGDGKFRFELSDLEREVAEWELVVANQASLCSPTSLNRKPKRQALLFLEDLTRRYYGLRVVEFMIEGKRNGPGWDGFGDSCGEPVGRRTGGYTDLDKCPNPDEETGEEDSSQLADVAIQLQNRRLAFNFQSRGLGRPVVRELVSLVRQANARISLKPNVVSDKIDSVRRK